MFSVDWAIKKENKLMQSPCNYSELFRQIEEDIKAELPDKSRTLIAEFVGYRHIELREQEQKEKRVN